MNKQSGLQIGLAATLFSMSVSLSGPNKIAAIVAGAILTVSSLVFYLKDRFSNPVWKKIVGISSHIDVSYTAFGLGFSGAGINLIRPGSLPIGVVFLLVGALFIGAGMGKSIQKLRLAYIRK